MEVPKDVKVKIIEGQLTKVLNTIYQEEINHRVYKKIGDENAVSSCVENLKKMEMAKDEYEKILKELEN